MIGRYAPSPTGAMHLGNARTALLAWLHTRAHGGQHLLRIEDLDVSRVRPYAYDLIRRDLTWLGLNWDTEYIQSERIDHYQAALTHLQIYPCTCTRRQIAEMTAAASAPHGPEAVYPGTCRHQHTDPSKTAALRWHVPDAVICLTDHWTKQTLCQNLLTEVGDFVLRRGDGVFAYHLAVVVDDAAMQVTDVVRGADLLSSTPRQIALQRALGAATPRYFHVPLMTDYKGERLAKRGGAPSLKDLRETGASPEKILSELARSLGWEVPEEVTAAELLPVYLSSLA
ncbi:tRNA glutamyl-Q(34) synthetase GluQRS [Deinococcus detaillensis]|uniref:Glutamyl-Q tRNA(Asp) synthetase n=1 Tax=Deinococcus detaillensis TaxID=2592048 RepID=A0A553UZP2_9DEIO|nr:tRNA glutamyl-Q(34) synthetase GluQRS [Deinococcus detaillensis]TSA85658.1 tRNA glutamyl-Q(34) synthetase GluQRS [Deinococcus detaillensis]